MLAVAKNPGHPGGGEWDRYRGKSGIDLLREYRRFQEHSIREVQDGRGGRFKRNLFEYLSSLLEVEVRDIYGCAAYTNLVKCSSYRETGSMEVSTKETCYETYLKDEIRLFAPKVLLALGHEVENFLHDHEWKWPMPPIIYIRHPSVYYPKDEKEEILADIKGRVQRAMELGDVWARERGLSSGRT
ncbi:MAG: hypothetical protein ACOC6F_01085 [bacterium]